MVPETAAPGPEWLDANAIAARTGGRRQPNTVRSWWDKWERQQEGGLAFEVFPSLGTKSNKRSHSDVVDAYLRRRNFAVRPPTEDSFDRGGRASSGDGSSDGPAGQPRLADVLDALISVKAAADAAMDAVIGEAEAAAQQAQAFAQQAHTRMQTYKKLRTMMHGYDMALSVLIHPSAPPPSDAAH